jgi:hypothetical protein
VVFPVPFISRVSWFIVFLPMVHLTSAPWWPGLIWSLIRHLITLPGHHILTLLTLLWVFLPVSDLWQMLTFLFLSGCSWRGNAPWSEACCELIHVDKCRAARKCLFISGTGVRRALGWMHCVRQLHCEQDLRKGFWSVFTSSRLTDAYPGFIVINTAQDMLIRISFPSSINLQDITIFITLTVFCRPKYVQTTVNLGMFLRLLHLNPNRAY